MPHCDPEALALHALGEPLPDADAAHLAGCLACQAEADQLRAVVSTARAVGPDDVVRQPPPAVWDRIAGALDLDAERASASGGVAVATDPSGEAAAGGGGDAAARSRAASVGASGSGPGAGSGAAGPVGGPGGGDELADRRARRRGWRFGALVAAAAVVGVIAGGAAVLAVRGTDTDAPLSVVATARLDPLPDKPGAATAKLEQGSDGQRYVAVSASGLPALSGAYYEVWLLTPDAKSLMSLGVLKTDERGRFDLPAGVDLAQYSVVDISREPMDGNPAHSKDSYVRGQFQA